MPQARQSVCVKARPATQIQNPTRLAAQERIVYPHDMVVDGLETAAGGIMLLRKMLLQHSFTEIRVIPGDIVAFGPGLGVGLATDEIKQIFDYCGHGCSF